MVEVEEEMEMERGVEVEVIKEIPILKVLLAEMATREMAVVVKEILVLKIHLEETLTVKVKLGKEVMLEMAPLIPKIHRVEKKEMETREMEEVVKEILVPKIHLEGTQTAKVKLGKEAILETAPLIPKIHLSNRAYAFM